MTFETKDMLRGRDSRVQRPTYVEVWKGCNYGIEKGWKGFVSMAMRTMMRTREKEGADDDRWVYRNLGIGLTTLKVAA
jgi:hypothetical protein